MVRSVGLDLVDIDRIAHSIHLYRDKFVTKILGPDEFAIYQTRQDKAIFVAGRFAAKEAIVKGLGQFVDKRPSLREIQILNDESGKPHINLDYARMGLHTAIRCHLSITHERNYAAAVAIFVEDE